MFRGEKLGGHDMRVRSRGMSVAGMPEITGDRQDTCPDPVENKRDAVQGKEDVPNLAEEHLPQPEACESPLRMRLHDFSGEGERAPPGM